MAECGDMLGILGTVACLPTCIRDPSQHKRTDLGHPVLSKKASALKDGAAGGQDIVDHIDASN
jgi:hypothetical protein